MKYNTRVSYASMLPVLGVLLLAPMSRAQQPVSHPNPVERLQAELDKGSAKLIYAQDGHGYLVSVLNALGVRSNSQLLVFSGGSLQFDRINQNTPRALYHNDDVSVGWVQGSNLLEFVTSDAKGLAFYSFDASDPNPRFERRTSQCIICHGFATRWAPGLMVTNTDTGPRGRPLGITEQKVFSLTDQRTPFDQRYGGWYVTGVTGAMAHRGNVTQDVNQIGVVPDGGRNLLSLSERLDIARYLQPSSDIVSLLTLEHQAGFVNLAMQLNAQYRGLDKNAADPRLWATPTDIDASIEELVRYMTFANEVPLPSPVTSQSRYASDFAAQGPRDDQGRSLRDFDLQQWTFRYPLSYMIYSETFDYLNANAKARVWRRLYDVLSGEDKDPAFTRAARDGAAAIAIVAATKPNLPAFWQAQAQR